MALKKLNPKQIDCLNDAIGHYQLTRVKAWHNFTGSRQHHSQTVYSLINIGCLTTSDEGYPLSVKINRENPIVKNLRLIGKRVDFKRGNTPITNDGMGLNVVGLGMKNNEVYFIYEAGGNESMPVSSIIKVH